jgi:hypothetical protein
MGSNRITHGTRSMRSHSTAFFNNVFNTVKTLLTVFGARSRSRPLSRWTSSLKIASNRFIPSSGTRWTLRIVSFAAMPLGF